MYLGERHMEAYICYEIPLREEKSGSKGGKGNLVLNFTRIKPQELFSTHKLQQTVDYSTGTTTPQQQKKKALKSITSLSSTWV